LNESTNLSEMTVV